MNALAIFDLDDTLIDTTNTLVPLALEAVARAIDRPVTSLDRAGKSIEEVLAPAGALSDAQRAAAAEAYYDPNVPALDPLPGAHATLRALQGRVHLALLTRGAPLRQRNKVEASGMAPYFAAFIVCDITRGGSKGDDIRRLMERFRTPPERTVVIGDDKRDELHHGETLGCATIHVPTVALASIPSELEKMGYLSSDQG